MLPIQLVLVTDRDEVETRLYSALEGISDMVIAARTASPQTTLAALADQTPDLLLLDAQLRHAVDLTRTVFRRYPSVSVVVVYADSPSGAQALFQAGATGCLLDGTTPAELRDALRSAYTGKTVISLSLLRHLLGRQDTNLST